MDKTHARPINFSVLKIGCISILVLFAACLLLARPIRQTPSSFTFFDDQISQRTGNLDVAAHFTGDWISISDGMTLPSGGSGQAIYHVRKLQGQKVTVLLWMYTESLAANAVEVSGDSVRYTPIVTDTYLSDYALPVDEQFRDSSEFWIRINATAAQVPHVDAKRRLVLDRVYIAIGSGSIDDSYLPGLLILVAWPVSVFFLLRSSGRQTVSWYALLFTAGFSLTLLFFPAAYRFTIDLRGCCAALKPQHPLILEYLRLPLLSALFPLTAGTVFLLREKNRKMQAMLFLACWVILLGAAIRWEELVAFQFAAHEPDAIAYDEIAGSMAHPYDTDFREPLWIWSIRIWHSIFGRSAFSLRFLTFFFGTCVLVISFLFFARYTGSSVIAIGVTTLLAFNPQLVFNSIRGLRLEIFICALMLFTYSVFVKSIPSRVRSTSLAFSGTAAAMIQLNALFFLIPLVLYAFWKHQISARSMITPVVVPVIFLGPYLAYCDIKFGDPFYAANLHARWYRNYEFIHLGGTRCSGCPDVDTYKRDAYSGAPISTFGYIFGMHPLSEVISNTAKGYARLFLRPWHYLFYLIGYSPRGIYYVYLAGMFLLLLTSFRELLLVPLLSVNFLAFLIPLDLDARLVLFNSPFVSFALVCAVAVPIRWLANGRRRFPRKEVAEVHITNSELSGR